MTTMADEATNLRDTIVPKSDQLNADDFLASGPMTVTITAVKRGNKEQPIKIEIDGRLPFYPCKSMRRVLIEAWGDDGKVWVGRSMTLFRDPDVRYGGIVVGGIRISHLSHIDKPVTMPLTVTRGKREPYKVEPLRKPAPAASSPVRDAMADAIKAGRWTRDQIVAFLKETYSAEKPGDLKPEQVGEVIAALADNPPAVDAGQPPATPEDDDIPS
jgi:hypothetical protein